MSVSLTVSPRRSKIQQNMIAAVHLAAAISFATVLQGWLLAAALCALLGSLTLALVRLRRNELSVWVLAANGELSLSESGGERLLRLEGSSTDLGWAIWLNWRDAVNGRRSARMLTRDQFDPGVWRQMRVWLRHLAIVGETPHVEPFQR